MGGGTVGSSVSHHSCSTLSFLTLSFCTHFMSKVYISNITVLLMKAWKFMFNIDVLCALVLRIFDCEDEESRPPSIGPAPLG